VFLRHLLPHLANYLQENSGRHQHDRRIHLSTSIAVA
jgi:hypothetical protein